MGMRALAAGVAIASVALAACGGSSSSTSPPGTPGDADSAEVATIKGWVGALQEGNVAKAAGYFAIPSVVQNGGPPVRIGDRRYVDGGLCSFTNADALVDQGCDVVIILSPFSSREHGSLLGTALYGPLRSATMLRLSRDAKLLREAGAEVVTVEPTAADLRAMGLNPMDRAPSRVVLETAVSSVAERAEELIAGIDLAPSRPAARGDRPPQAAAA